MPKQFVNGVYYETLHTIIPAQATVFNVVPHLAEARAMANLYEEPVAIYRYYDDWPEDIFIRPLISLDEAHRRHFERLVIEAVVNPAKEG